MVGMIDGSWGLLVMMVVDRWCLLVWRRLVAGASTGAGADAGRKGRRLNAVVGRRLCQDAGGGGGVLGDSGGAGGGGWLVVAHDWWLWFVVLVGWWC